MIIDCAIHPVLEHDELNRRIGPPFNLRPLPSIFGDKYQAPFDQLSVSVEDAGSPAAVSSFMRDAQIDYAVLSPTTRGYWPNPQQADAVMRSVNSMLAERWLSAAESQGRFFGSIRVAPNDTDLALREIDRWGGDERFVQLVVPARALAVYGDQRFFPIWRKAVELGLPVFIHDDMGTIVEPPPSQVGFQSFFAEAHALRPLSSIVHVATMITAGVFDRLPDLRVILGDVSVHAARSLLIRTDKDWQTERLEVPWVTKDPTLYLDTNVRFISQADDEISPHSISASDTVGGENASLVMFGSRHPYWDDTTPARTFPAWNDVARARCLAGNALDFYPRLAARISAEATA